MPKCLHGAGVMAIVRSNEPDACRYLVFKTAPCCWTGQYREASQQFRDDVAVNPNDTEEAIWAFLAEARLSGPETARQNFLKARACMLLTSKQGIIPQMFISPCTKDLQKTMCHTGWGGSEASDASSIHGFSGRQRSRQDPGSCESC